MSQGRVFAPNPFEGLAPAVIGADAADYFGEAGETQLKYPLLDEAKVLAMQQPEHLSDGGSNTSTRSSLAGALEASSGWEKPIQGVNRRSMRSSTPLPVVELASDSGECSLRC